MSEPSTGVPTTDPRALQDPSEEAEPLARQALRHSVRLAVSLLLAGLVAWLARVPMGDGDQHARLRLALYTASGRIEVCRDRTPEELEALALHMRQPRVCDWLSLPYRLKVTVDGQTRVDRLLHSAGLREDRPLITDESLELQPGTVTLGVSFAPEAEQVEDGPKAEAWRLAVDAAPRYQLDRTVELETGRITLVRLEGGRFTVER